MMSYYKLVEMNNNGVRITITNVTYADNGQGGQKWCASARKEAEGVSLSIREEVRLRLLLLRLWVALFRLSDAREY